MTLMLLATEPADDQPQGVAFTTAVVAERMPLPKMHGPVKLIVDSMGARLEIVAPRDRAAVAGRIAAHAAWICPKVIDRPEGVELRCRTRHLDATITTDNGVQYLDIRELRGLPWREGSDGPPFFFYDPEATGLGGACPGNSVAGVGECALQSSAAPLDAARRFRAALRTPHRQLAALRLGDIALFTGDPATAMGWYRRAGTLGVFGRVARTRICEVDGTCLGSSESLLQVFDSSGLPAPVKAEMALRAIRAEAYQDRFASALNLLADRIGESGYANLCRDKLDGMCRRILLEIMRQKSIANRAVTTMRTDGASRNDILDGRDDAARRNEEGVLAEKALRLYLELPGWDRGPYAVELADAAADLAAYVGGPVFGGNILSAVAPMVAPADLADHLAHAAELFIDGGDETRAKLVVEYAASSAPRKMQTPRWKAIHKALASVASEGEGSAAKAGAAAAAPVAIDPEAVAREAAAALAVSNRAKELIKKRGTAPGGPGGQP
ncbi:MAG TPA: hypothetical protein VNO55_02280 [Polyangia bacterium]|nr:hypothetical protein [Polyangia bacterium]